MVNDAVIVARGLTKRFDDVVAVDGIDIEIMKGECFGFLGPNGAGKTSTMKMIYCASPKTSGSLTVMGMDVDAHPREIKGNIGVVQQENNLDPDFTLMENLTIFSRYFGIPPEEAKKRAEKLIDFMQLQKKKDTNIEELSGGMKRRLMVARSLINDPKMLILDEPTTGLDPQAKHLIWSQLRSLMEEGITIILTTHYMEEAAQLCDRLVIMNEGKILVKGSPAELVEEHGGGSEVLEIAAERSVMKKIAEYLKDGHRGGKVSIEDVGERLYIYAEGCHELEKDLASRFEIRERLFRMTNLEDVFLKLTGRGLRE